MAFNFVGLNLFHFIDNYKNNLMKKPTQQKSKQCLHTVQEPMSHYDSRNESKRHPGEINTSNVRYYQSHPFSQVKLQNYYSNFRNRPPVDSRIEINSRGGQFSRYYPVREARRECVPTENIVLLRQRLKNIHDYYKELINDQKAKNAEKGEVIIGLLLQMQNNHNQKILQIRKSIQESEQQKRDVGFVDDKMNEIKGNIDELINQSNLLKGQNEELEKQIAQKSRVNEQKEAELQELNQELLESRTELEQFELVNLKNNKINKQIVEIFNSASTISSN